MKPATSLSEGLIAIARKSVVVKTTCKNEESTKYHLVLPMLALLGYDPNNPYEIYHEFAAGYAGGDARRVDLVILRENQPQIAIECKAAGTDLSTQRGQLRAYFNALLPVKVGVLTNGIVFEFFVDVDNPNVMDADPFLTVDLEHVARSGASDELIETLLLLTKSRFNASTIAECAHLQLVKKRLRTVFLDEAKSPSDKMCRLALEGAGLKNVKQTAIDRHYRFLVKSAFEESLVVPVVNRLRSQQRPSGPAATDAIERSSQRVATTERERAIYKYVRRRLAFLVEDEVQFDEIEQIRCKDYIGKLSVYYQRTNKGRIFDFIEGVDGYDKFIFPEPIGQIVTKSIRDIDAALKATFIARVREYYRTRAAAPERLAKIA